ncbi:unnamed protein product [Lathyrus oleraceus]
MSLTGLKMDLKFLNGTLLVRFCNLALVSCVVGLPLRGSRTLLDRPVQVYHGWSFAAFSEPSTRGFCRSFCPVCSSTVFGFVADAPSLQLVIVCTMCIASCSFLMMLG